MVFPQTPLSFTVELWYDGAWQNITSDVRHSDKIQIFRGRRAESGRPEPGSCRMTLSNRSAKYSPDNPMSPLYGKIGRNTLLKVSVNGVGRFVGEVSTWPPQWTEGGRDAWVSIEASGILRRLENRRSPLYSTLRRRVTSEPTVLAYWPMEDEAEATSVSSPLPGVSPMRVSGFTFAADTSLAGSAGLPTLQATASMLGVVPASTSTGGWNVTVLLNMAAAPSVTARLLEITTSGTAARQVIISLTNTGGLRAEALDVDGVSTVMANAIGLELYGGWVRMEITAQETAGSTYFRFRWMPLASGVIYSPDYTITGTSGAVTQVSSPFGAGLAGIKLGHLGVFAQSGTSIYDLAELGFLGEAARTRFIRLCGEEGVAAGSTASASTAMGAQQSGRLLDLLYECADADGGIIYESRTTAQQLNYRTRVNLYNQASHLVLDYRQHIMPGLQPVSDDQTTVNDMTVSRVNGSSARAVQATGTLSVLDAPAGVGRYDQSQTVNVLADSQLPDMASWAVHLGTVDEPRYPVIPINLARNYSLADAAMALIAGDRITVTNTPAWLPPDGIDVIVQGFTETISSVEWTMAFIGSPASPWTVAGADTPASWTDTDGAALAGAMTSTDTTALVRTTTGPVWSSSLQDTPVTVRVGGEVMRLDAPGALLNTNPYFDADIAGWSGQNSSVAWSTTQVHPQARGSLRITPNGTDSQGGAGCTLTPVGSINPGGVYTVSMWAYSPTGWSDLQPCVDWYDASSGYLATGYSVSGLGAVSAGQWTFLQQTVTAPASASRASMRARHAGTPGADKIWYAWAVRLTRPKASWLYDNCGRTVTSGWGTADSGQAWNRVGGGPATDYNVGSGYANQILSTLDTSRRTSVTAVHPDADIYADITTSALATGDSLYGGVTARMLDASNMYLARLEFTTGNLVVLSVRKIVADVQTQLGAVTMPVGHAAGQWVRVRFQVQGSTLRARGWLAGAPEPAVWHVTATDTAITAANQIGTRSIRSTGNTNAASVEVRYRAFDTVTPQAFSVTRSVNGVVKAQAAGADVRLATPAIVAL